MLSDQSESLPVLPLTDRYRAKLDFIMRWLVDTGFPFDWSYRDGPLPSWLRDELAVVWSAKDNEPVGNMDWAMRQEQAWDDDKTPASEGKQS